MYRETEEVITAELNIEEKKSKIEKILRWKRQERASRQHTLSFGKDTPLKKLHGSQQVVLSQKNLNNCFFETNLKKY